MTDVIHHVIDCEIPQLQIAIQCWGVKYSPEILQDHFNNLVVENAVIETENAELEKMLVYARERWEELSETNPAS